VTRAAIVACMRVRTVVIAAAGLLLVVALGAVSSCVDVRTDHDDPPDDPSDALVDDSPADKTPPTFDPSLVHPVRVGENGAWLENRSAAQFRLDVPVVAPDLEPWQLELRPTYKAAIDAGRAHGEVLPSVNMLDGKAKQFDDGLCAALDLACHAGIDGALEGDVHLVRRIFDAVPRDGAAAPFLAAGLAIADVRVDIADSARAEKWKRAFEKNELASKPIGFFTWSDALGQAFRFHRFFKTPLDSADRAVASEISAVFARDAALRADQERRLALSARVHNPAATRPLVDVDASTHGSVALFPPMSSRETELFARLFPDGVPRDTSLMSELVRRVRSGEVDLSPRPNAGWLDHQVHALETLLLPERGEERNKLILTKRYKKRMLEAFEALLTKRLETHMMAAGYKSESLRPPQGLRPTMRVEPCPTYYLRTARAYAFLAGVLDAALGEKALRSIRGLRDGGDRGVDAFTELRSTRDLFYGLHLVSCDDLGLRPAFAKDEPVDADACRAAATAWLARAFDDPDLAVDTRVAIPVYADDRTTRCWGTLGVRVARLNIRWETRPRLKPADGPGEWTEAPDCDRAQYLIPVDEFGEFSLRAGHVLSREEFRKACGRGANRAEILDALNE